MIDENKKKKMIKRSSQMTAEMYINLSQKST
jgi:hypothetical protein